MFLAAFTLIPVQELHCLSAHRAGGKLCRNQDAWYEIVKDFADQIKNGFEQMEHSVFDLMDYKQCCDHILAPRDFVSGLFQEQDVRFVHSTLTS